MTPFQIPEFRTVKAKPWHYTLVSLPAQDAPLTCVAFLERTDAQGNYRGIEIGRFKSGVEACEACKVDKNTRKDWRSATEVDLNDPVNS